MRVLTINLGPSSVLAELTECLKAVSSETYEHKQESVFVIIRCEGMIDCASESESVRSIGAWEKALRQLEMGHAFIIFISDSEVFGYAFDLLLISDVRILCPDSRMGFSMRDGASLPRMSLYRLANQVGQAHARRLGLAAIVLGADEALQLGLADEISDDLAESLDSALAKFGDAPTSELAIRRRLILEAHALEYDNALGAYLAACARSQPRMSA